MKKKIKLILFVCVLFILIAAIGTVAVAEDVKIQAVSGLLNERYPIENYRSYLSTKTGFLGLIAGDTVANVFGAFADFSFKVTQMLYQVFDFFVEVFYSMNVLDRLNNIVGLLTNNLWNLIRANYVVLMIVIALLAVGKTYFIDGAKQALYQFSKIILVLVVSMVWFPRANQYLSSMNNYSFAFQADIMRVAGQVDATSAIATEGGTSTEAATNVMRNELFKQTIYQPFLLLNYGTVNAEEINKLYENIDDNNIPKNNNGEYLLSEEFNSLEDSEKKNILNKLAEENRYLTGDEIHYKFIIAIISIICLFLYGVPLVAIAFCNLLLQVAAILYSYILPVVAVLAILPRFSNGLISSILNIAKIFMGKGLLALAVLMFTLLNLTIDLMIPPSSFTTVIANIVTKGLIYWVLWKFREPILRAITRAILQRRDSVYLNNRVQQFNKGMNDFYNETQPSFTPEYPIGYNPERGSQIPEPEVPPYQDNQLADEIIEGQYEVVDETDQKKDKVEVEDTKIPTEPIEDPNIKDPEIDDSNINVPDTDDSEINVPGIDDPDINVPDLDDPQVDVPNIEDIDVNDDIPDSVSSEDPSTGQEREFPEGYEPPEYYDRDSPAGIDEFVAAGGTFSDSQTGDHTTSSNTTSSNTTSEHESKADQGITQPPIKNDDVENLVNRQIKLYQQNNDNRTQLQQNDYNQESNVTVNNISRNVHRHDKDFSKRLNDYRR